MDNQFSVMTCINNAGAEDQLTIGKKYNLRPVTKRGTRHYYELINDKHKQGLYEQNRFN